MHKMIVSIIGAAVLSGPIAFVVPVVRAQGAPAATATPDFSGVYYPVQQGRGGGGQRAGAPPAAARGGCPAATTASARFRMLAGRSPDAPSLTPEYMAKWEMMRKSRMTAHTSSTTTRNVFLQDAGLMGMAYGMEVMPTKDKITFFSELNDALRRVYLDGRKPTPRISTTDVFGVLDRPWEGDTLVIETVALHPDSFIEGFTPHSDAMTVKSVCGSSPGMLEDRITVTDPKALTKPWETVRTYRKAMLETTS